MAGWETIKSKARGVVHTTFERPAVYRLGAGADQPCTVRLHVGQQLIGDLDREGFAQVMQDINRIKFKLSQVTPRTGAIVTISSTGFKFRLETAEQSDDAEYQLWNVTPHQRSESA